MIFHLQLTFDKYEVSPGCTPEFVIPTKILSDILVGDVYKIIFIMNSIKTLGSPIKSIGNGMKNRSILLPEGLFE